MPLASMATDTGWFATAFVSAASSLAGTSWCPSIETTGGFCKISAYVIKE